jgi:APA family basic amino acid/polyamine antiporter
MSVTMSGSSKAAARGSLLRVFGLMFALAIAIGTTIGGGILRTPGEIAALLPSVYWIFAIWVFGSINALLGAGAFSELGAMLPCAGGPYVFARRALGDFAGFFVGYLNWFSNNASTAAIALVVGEYSATLFPQLAGQTTAVALSVFLVLVALNWVQVRAGGWVQKLTTLAKLLGLGVLVVAAFVMIEPQASAVAPAPMPQGVALLAALALAMQAVIFTFDGYYYTVYFGEELKDPGREIPRGMFRSLYLIIGMYLLLNAAFLWAIPLDQLAHDPFAGGTVAHLLFGFRGDQLLTLIVVISMIGVINSGILCGPRILLDMGRDRLCPPQVTRVNRGGTPDVALLATALVTLAFLVSGAFDSVLKVTASLMAVLSASMFVCVIVLRKREPDLNRPYRSWGYPWTTYSGLAIAVAFLVGVMIADPLHSWIALGLLLATWPVYRAVVMLRDRATSTKT